MTEPLQICMHTFTRSAYYGGRVEVFREEFDIKETGKPLSYGDVNSMYPWAMLSVMPCDLSFVRTGKVDIERSHELGYLGFIECKVRIPENCYLPPLPVRHNGKLIFPTGVFNGVWTSAEISLLRRIGGHIISFGRSAWFRGREVFADFVVDQYRRRNKLDANYSMGRDLTAKLFLNSLYGKMGMNAERETLWFHPTEEDLASHTLRSVSEPQFGMFSEIVVSQPQYVIPHIAAWVTSTARARLWTLMQDFLDAGHLIYYCDTDSIITSGEVGNSSKLGDLKLVGKVKRFLAVAPKMYYCIFVDDSEYVKAKGFSSGFGAKGLSEAEFIRIVKHHTKVKISRMRKLREGVRSGERFPAMMNLEKGVKRKGVLDDKRIHLTDGDTRPVHIEG